MKLEDLIGSLGLILLWDDLKDFPEVINPKSPVGFPAPHHWTYGLLLTLGSALIKLKREIDNYKYAIMLDRELGLR